MLLILINIFRHIMLITDKVVTRKPIMGHQTLPFLVNRFISTVEMISGLLSLSVNRYLCTLPMPDTKTRSQVVAEIADHTASQQTI